MTDMRILKVNLAHAVMLSAVYEACDPKPDIDALTKFYHLLARKPLPQFTSLTVDRSELRSLRVNREGMNCLCMYLPFPICKRFTYSM